MTTSYTSFYELVYGGTLRPTTAEKEPTKESLEAAVKVLNEKIEEIEQKSKVVFKKGTTTNTAIKDARSRRGVCSYYKKGEKYYDIDFVYATGDCEVDFDYDNDYRQGGAILKDGNYFHVVESPGGSLHTVHVIHA